MRLIAHIAGAEHSAVRELALDREHVLLGVRNAVADGVGGNSADGDVLRPVEAGIGMAAGRVQWSKREREILAEAVPRRSGDERIRKQRRSGTAVGGAVGSVGREDSDGKCLDRGVIHSETGAKTGFAGTAQDLAEESAGGYVGRISEAEARRKFVAGGGEGAPDSGIGRVQDSCGRAWKN